MTEHIVTSFDTDLSTLNRHLMEMGRLVDSAFVQCIEALLRQNASAGAEVIRQDLEIDALETKIEEEAIQIIVRRQPLAIDLRDIIAALRTASDLERIGDLAKNIAKRARVLDHSALPVDLSDRLEQMASLAHKQLHQVLLAYAERDAGKAIEIRDNDGEIDILHTSFFKESIAQIANTYKNVAGITHLLFCAKNIERIGDHIANISENVYFIATGHLPAEQRRKLDESSSVVGNAP
jgi:phosphate transport system protein